MSILVNSNSRVLVQGITGSEGTFHTNQMVEYGTKVVAGVTYDSVEKTNINGQEVIIAKNKGDSVFRVYIDDKLVNAAANRKEAIEIANDTPYGLLNFIQTQDQEKANRVARKLRSGMVDINGAGLAADAPFGGYKHSGIGREAGKLGLEEYLEVKAVSGWND